MSSTLEMNENAKKGNQVLPGSAYGRLADGRSLFAIYEGNLRAIDDLIEEKWGYPQNPQTPQRVRIG